MTQTYNQMLEHQNQQAARTKPRFSGHIQRGVLAYLLEHGTAFDREIADAIDSVPLSVRSSIYELRTAGLVQVADARFLKTKPYGLTRAGIELALQQESLCPFVFTATPSPHPGAAP